MVSATVSKHELCASGVELYCHKVYFHSEKIARCTAANGLHEQNYMDRLCCSRFQICCMNSKLLAHKSVCECCGIDEWDFIMNNVLPQKIRLTVNKNVCVKGIILYRLNVQSFSACFHVYAQSYLSLHHFSSCCLFHCVSRVSHAVSGEIIKLLYKAECGGEKLSHTGERNKMSYNNVCTRGLSKDL